MTCYNPKYAKYSYGKGKKTEISKNITFTTKYEWMQGAKALKADPIMKNRHGLIMIPCGKCIGCRLDKAASWGLRGLLESKQWKNNCFITLTYNDQHLPKDRNLHKEDVQDFLKRLRKHYQGIEPREWNGKIEYSIRYFYSGEYGDLKLRPHFHIGIFNWKPDDLKFLKFNEHGDPMYTSEKIKKLWSIADLNGNYNEIGFHTVEEMNYNTAQYIGRYTAKKCFGMDDEKIKSKGLKKEFIETSRRGGLAYQILENKKEWEKMKRNYGFFIKDKNGKLKLKKIPQFYKEKWKKQDIYEYYEKADEHAELTNKNMEEILNKTDLTKEEYLKQQKETLIIKLKNAKSLKRNKIK